MKTLSQIKDEVAVKNGYDGWENDVIILIDFGELSGDKVDEMLNEVAELYAEQKCMEQREICAENAKANFINIQTRKSELKDIVYYGKIKVNKQSILNAPLATKTK